MNCLEFESIAADYLDGTLSREERASLEQHAAVCANCSEFLADVSGGLNLLRQAEQVDPPRELITRIAYLAPRGAARDPLERRGLWARMTGGWLLPVLQPRLAMSMAMTILSFAMLVRCTGVQVQRVRPADLSPLRVWGTVEDRALRIKDEAVKYYENLRIVYEVESHLRDLQEPAPATPARFGPAASTNSTGSQARQPQPEGSKK